MSYIYIGEWFASASIGSDNVLLPVRRQTITWTNDEMLSTGPLGTNLRENRINIQKFAIHESAFRNAFG